MRILLVKTSSLGDVVHNLPMASDIRRAFPDSRIDWVVEEAFASIPRMHASVDNVLPVAIRRWRTRPFAAETWREIARFGRELRSRRYQAVIDSQGLLKSAVITCSARGRSFGLDWKSAREPLRPFYDHTFAVPRTLHAVERNRALAALAMGYRAPARVEYALVSPQRRPAWSPRGRYAVLLHATSQERKLWPEERWVETARGLAGFGLSCVLPWHSAAERARSERLAAAIPGALVPPALSLEEVAFTLAAAAAVIGVDTGLTHLAAAFGRPTIGIYCATDTAATGLYGCERAVNLGGIGRAPTASQVREALDGLLREKARAVNDE